MLPKDAFDFCKVDDVKDCQEFVKHVSSMLDESGNLQEKKSFFSGVARIFGNSNEQENDTISQNLPKITAMCVVNPANSTT